MAQLVRNLPTVQETWVQFVGWEGPLEKGKATHSRILAWRIPWASPRGRKESDTAGQLSLSLSQVALVVNSPPANAGDERDGDSIPGWGRSPGQEMATHTSILD